MRLLDYLLPENIFVDTAASSKKKALEIASEYAAKKLLLPTKDIFEALIQRERLGSTAIGQGIAIPHCRLALIQKPYIQVLKLNQGVDFQASDSLPVDILIPIYIPEDKNDEYLTLLANLAAMLSNKSNLTRLRQAQDARSLYSIMVSLYA